MAFAKVDVYTSAIPQAILTPTPFGFPSGSGGGGGSGIVVYPQNYNMLDAGLANPVVVAIGGEVSVVLAVGNLTGNNNTMLMAFAAVQGPAIDATFKMYANGNLIATARSLTPQAFAWGSKFLSVAGNNTIELRVANNGQEAFTISSGEILGVELI